MINVLLVEDHELYRMGLSMLLDKAEDINLVAEASDGFEGVRKARDFSPNVILMDIGLPNMDGIEATSRIKEFLPDTKILIFTSRDSEHDIFESFKAGADGYIMKGASPEQTITAIKSVYEGIKKSDGEMSDNYKQYVCECIENFFMTEEELDNEIEKLVSNDTDDILRRFMKASK